jgi:hypothetical protein
MEGPKAKEIAQDERKDEDNDATHNPPCSSSSNDDKEPVDQITDEEDVDEIANILGRKRSEVL